jgi:Skp family chaperone for outer membrane proteins
MKAFILAAILLLLSAATAFGQSSRVAMIDVDLLDKANGIQRLYAVRKLIMASDPCDHRCSSMEQDINSLEKEIAHLKCASEPLRDRESRLQKLREEYDQVRVSAKERTAYYYNLWMKPLVDDIRDMTKKFAAERGYAIVLDKSSAFDSSVLIEVDEKDDVTTEFVAFCNAEFARREKK